MLYHGLCAPTLNNHLYATLEELNAGQTDMPHAYARIFGLYFLPGIMIVPIPWPEIALNYRLSLTRADLSWRTWLWFLH